MQSFISYPLFYFTYRLRSVWLLPLLFLYQGLFGLLWGQKTIVHGLDRQTDTITVHSGDKYFDSGGPGGSKLPDQPGNYVNCSDPFNESQNCTSVFTLCSNSDTVAVNFVAYQIVTGDRLRIYPGSETKGGTLFNSQTQGVSLNGMKLTTGTFIKSNAADGCLTFEWFCTTIGNSIGWEIDVIVLTKNLPSDTLCIPRCKPAVTVSIPQDTCYKEISLNEILEGHQNECGFDLTLFYPFGTDRLERGGVNGSHLNSTFLFEVKSSGSSCFGYVQIMESLPPFAFCASDTISCLQWEQNPAGVTELSTCSGLKINYKNIRFEALPCDQALTGLIIREIEFKSTTVTTCRDTLFLLKPALDSLICPSEIRLSCELIPTGAGASSLTPAFLQSLLDKNQDNRPDSDPSGYLSPGWPGFSQLDSLAFCRLLITYSDFVIPGCGNTYKIRRQWVIKSNCLETDTVCIQNILIEDVSGPLLPTVSPMEFQVAPSDCKAQVSLDTFTGIRDCNSVVQRLELIYRDPLDPSKQIVINNFLPVKLSLPPGGYTAKFLFSDQCFNASRTEVCFQVISNERPVAKARTAKYVIDPGLCWSRVYAKDLDSLSSDVCCAQLHFAIAQEDSVNYYTQYWKKIIETQCNGDDRYSLHQNFYDELIDRWITAFVFKDYLDLGACISHRILFRAFESCNLPPVDAGFACGPHQWFCYLTIPEFRGWKNSLAGNIICSSAYTPGCFTALAAGLFTLDDSFKYPEARVLEDTGSCSKAYTAQHLTGIVRNYSEIQVRVEVIDTFPPEISLLPDLFIYTDGAPTNPVLPGSPVLACSENPVPAGSWPGAFTCNCDTTHFNKYYGGPLRNDAIYDQNGNYTYPSCQFYSDPGNPRPVYCRNVLFRDTLPDQHVHPDSLFFSPVFNQIPGNKQFNVQSNCAMTYLVSFRDSLFLDSCRRGKIIRYWSLANPCGTIFKAAQTLNYRPKSDFEVIFPADLLLDCSTSGAFDPSVLPLPLVKDADVEDIEIRFIDSLVQNGSSACRVLVRKWEITDRCLFENENNLLPDIIINDSLVADRQERYCVYRALKDNGDGYMHYYQFIRFMDQTPPHLSLADTILQTSVDCQAGAITLTPQYTDNCSPPEGIQLEVYLDTGTGLEQKLPFAGSILIPAGLIAGEYGLRVIGRDLCGNTDSIKSTVSIVDASAPVAFCGNSTIPVTLPASGQMTIYAKDFDAGSMAGCTPGPVKFSFSPDPSDSVRILNCDSTGLRNYTVWITNTRQKQTTCQVVLQVNGLQNTCFPSSEFQLGGVVTTGQKNGINKVSIKIEPTLVNIITDNTGSYQSPFLKGGQDYTVRPGKQDNPLNGVSSIDLLIMEKHILGQALLTDSYLQIAADVNQSGSITVSDLIELRRLILGNITAFGKNEVWNFIPSTYKFPDPANPWIYPRTIPVKNLAGNISDLNFIGIKTGDVNYSALLNLGSLESRAGEHIDLRVKTKKIPEGTQISVYILSPIKSLYAVQLGFQVDQKVKAIRPAGGQLMLTDQESNFQDGDQFKIAWVDPAGITLNTTDPILVLDVIGGSGPVGSQLMETQNYPSFLYFDQREFGINWLPDEANTNGIKIYPNPGKGEVNIDFFIEDLSSSLVTILGTNGKKVYIKNSELRPGWNHILLNKSDLGGAGLYYFVKYLGRSMEKSTFMIF